jgi:hypothetical protein
MSGMDLENDFSHGGQTKEHAHDFQDTHAEQLILGKILSVRPHFVVKSFRRVAKNSHKNRLAILKSW